MNAKMKEKKEMRSSKKNVKKHSKCNMPAARDNVVTSKNNIWPLVFDTKMRKMLVKGVLQDIKGYVEMRTGGAVSVEYEEFSLGEYEFAFKMHMSKDDRCSKQTFSEASCAVVNAVGYAFAGDLSQYDVAISSSDDELEVEFVSKW